MIAQIALVLMVGVIFLILATSPTEPRRCLHWAGGLGCQNMTTRISGYCEACANDWGPGI